MERVGFWIPSFFSSPSKHFSGAATPPPRPAPAPPTSSSRAASEVEEAGLWASRTSGLPSSPRWGQPRSAGFFLIPREVIWDLWFLYEPCIKSRTRFWTSLLPWWYNMTECMCVIRQMNVLSIYLSIDPLHTVQFYEFCGRNSNVINEIHESQTFFSHINKKI